jgi:hypothetical protein
MSESGDKAKVGSSVLPPRRMPWLITPETTPPSISTNTATGPSCCPSSTLCRQKFDRCPSDEPIPRRQHEKPVSHGSTPCKVVAHGCYALESVLASRLTGTIVSTILTAREIIDSHKSPLDHNRRDRQCSRVRRPYIWVALSTERRCPLI